MFVNRHQSGFSLVELIIVIVISGILAGILSTFIARPVQGFIDLSRRATLVYSAESAMRRMQRDIRRALPNSIRVNAGNNALEMINTVEGARYRSAPPPGQQVRRLTFTSADADFDVLGTLNTNGATSLRVAIYNIGAVDLDGDPIAGANAYAGPDIDGKNVVTPAGRTITVSDAPVTANEDHINISGGGFHFSFDSPNDRVYLVDTGISYVCDGNQLMRYDNYNFSNVTQPVPPSGNAALMADNIDACTFTYEPGTVQRAGLMTLDLTISDPGTGEQVRLLHQVHVDNVP